MTPKMHDLLKEYNFTESQRSKNWEDFTFQAKTHWGIEFQLHSLETKKQETENLEIYYINLINIFSNHLNHASPISVPHKQI